MFSPSRIVKFPSNQVVAHSGIIGTLFRNTVHLPPKAAPWASFLFSLFFFNPQTFSFRHPWCPQSSSIHPVNISIYTLYLNECRFSGKKKRQHIAAALLDVYKKINIFTSVQEVITLIYKISCFPCFLFPTGSWGNREKEKKWSYWLLWGQNNIGYNHTAGKSTKIPFFFPPCRPILDFFLPVWMW